MAIELVIPSLPEGWTGTPQDLLDWISENATVQGSGATAFTGQIGGAMPTTNVGLYVMLGEGDSTASQRSVQGIYYWNGTTYLPLPTVPIGGLIDWPSTGALPLNYVEADGATYAKTDYPELYAVYKALFLRSTDNIDTTFRVPDCRGRYTAGAGIGQYNPQQVTSGWLGTGTTMLSLQISGASDGVPESHGPYLGWEWPTPKIPVGQQNMPPHPTLTSMLADAKFAKDYPFTKLTTYYHGIRPPTLVTRKIIFAGRKRT